MACTAATKYVDSFFEWSTVPTEVSSNAPVTPVNLIVLGTAEYNRIGRRIKNLWLYVRAELIWSYNNISLPGGGQIVGNAVRVAFVWDKQPNGGPVPLFSDIFGDTYPNGITDTSYLSFENRKNVQRFEVLKEEYLHFVPEVDNLIDDKPVEVIRVIEREFPICKKSHYLTNISGSNPEISDINTGALYVVMIAKYESYFGNSIQCSGTARLVFQDD